MQASEWYQSGQYAEINGLKVFYKQGGSGTPLVCIHGFPSSSWDFEKIWPALSAKFNVIAPDLIGLGKSAKPDQPLPVSLQADMIESLLLQLGVQEAHILSHDLGDTIAQEILARKKVGSSPINWLSCIMLNGGIFPETHRPLLIQKLLISPLGSFISGLMSENAFRKNMNRIFSKEHPPSDDFIKATWQLIIENNGRKMIPKLIRYMRERSEKRDRWVDPLKENIVPLRLINGIEDPISGKHAADRYAEIVPNADIIRIEKSGHYPHLETPKEVIDAIYEFHHSLHDLQNPLA